MADVAFAGLKVRIAAVALEERRRLSHLGRHVQLVLVPIPTGSRRKHLAAPLADYGTVVLNEVFQQLGKQCLLIFFISFRSLSAPSRYATLEFVIRNDTEISEYQNQFNCLICYELFAMLKV